MSFSVRVITGQYRLIWICAIAFTAFFNLAFFKYFLNAFPLDEGNTGFFISVIVCLFAVHGLVFSLLGGRFFTKLFLILGFLIGVSATYFSWRYDLIIDSAMLQTIRQGDTNLELELASLEWLLVLLIGVGLPAYLILKAPVGYHGLFQEIRAKVFSVGAAVMLVAISMVPFSARYTSLYQEYKHIGFYAAPLFPIYSIGQYAGRYIDSSSLENQMQNGTIDEKVVPEHSLVVLIVGHTARADHFSLNGYQQQTNPRLSQRDGVISFTEIESCGSPTATSDACLFTLNFPDGSDSQSIYNKVNALDTLIDRNIAVLWRDHNVSNQQIAERFDYQSLFSSDLDTSCYPNCSENGMLIGLDEYVNQHPNQDVLIVLNAMESHGPIYFTYYPQDFEKFKPMCNSTQLSDCSSEEITNAYDNTIVFTDFFIDRSIDWLDNYSDQYQTALLFVSDNDESLAKDEVYLRGMPFMITSADKPSVTTVAWLNHSSPFSYADVVPNKDILFSHDHLYCSLLSLFKVETDSCGAGQSIFYAHTEDK